MVIDGLLFVLEESRINTIVVYQFYTPSNRLPTNTFLKKINHSMIGGGDVPTELGTGLFAPALR